MKGIIVRVCDGMLSGILEHEGRKLKFEIITDYSQNTTPRTFAMIKLTEKDKAWFSRSHI